MRIITEDSGLNGTCRVPPGGKACLAGAGAQARAETTRLLGRTVARRPTSDPSSKGHSPPELEAPLGSPSLGGGSRLACTLPLISPPGANPRPATNQIQRASLSAGPSSVNCG